MSAPVLIWNVFVWTGGAYLVTRHGWNPATMIICLVLTK